VKEKKMGAALAYEQMTPSERDQYNALVARLDDMLCERKSKERRLKAEAIAFEDRRIADRRKFPR
jgi:hypothetical protein